MSCELFRDQLALFTYGDLPADVAAPLEQHLAACPACRQEYAGLQRLRDRLDAFPIRDVRVDLARLYGDVADQQRRRTRRWRYVAAAAASAAAVLLAFLLTRCEVRLDSQQFVLRWDAASPPAAPLVDASAARVVQVVQGPAASDEQIKLLKELVHALADEVKSRDLEQQQRLARLSKRFQELERSTDLQRLAVNRDVAALYMAFFGPKEKGTKQ